MRILLLKSLLLCTNYPSFLPILCGILLFLPWNPFCFCRGFLCVYSFFLFVFAVDLFLLWMPFVFAVNPFCFCRGFVFVSVVDLFLLWMPLCIFLLPFCFCLFFSRHFNFLLRNPKNVGDFFEKVHRFFENLHRFFVFLGDVAKLSCFQMCL